MSRNVHHYPWTPEMDSTLKELYDTCPAKEIAKIINAKFGTGFSYTAIQNRIHAKKLSTKVPYHWYTEEQDEWLCQNISHYTYPDLVVAFNEKFHTSQSYYNIKSHCQRKGFQGGSSYQKGYANWRKTPIGTEKIYNGRIYVKVSEAPSGREKKNHMGNWKPKGQVVWEQHHGKVPDGYCVVYLDGNPLNCDISNLECTTNSIQGYASMTTHGCSPELKRCAIKMKTLEKILEEVERNEG